MTRINLVPVKHLADQHLAAERREIKMVPASLRRSLKTRKTGDILAGIPQRYTLNVGHVTFFFDKMKFLTERYILLTDELLNRGYNLSDNSADFTQFIYDIPAEFNRVNWQPDHREVKINVERILLRISEKPHWYKYYGDTVDMLFFDMYK